MLSLYFLNCVKYTSGLRLDARLVHTNLLHTCICSLHDGGNEIDIEKHFLFNILIYANEYMYIFHKIVFFKHVQKRANFLGD